MNELTFAGPIDTALFGRVEAEVGQAMRAVEGFAGFHVVQTSDTRVVLLIFADGPDALDRIATEVGSPWMRANVVPHLARPPERRVGDVLASVLPVPMS